MNEYLPLLRLSVYAPLLFKLAGERKLTNTDKTVLRLVGVVTLAYNGYLLFQQYAAGKAAQGV